MYEESFSSPAFEASCAEQVQRFNKTVKTTFNISETRMQPQTKRTTSFNILSITPRRTSSNSSTLSSFVRVLSWRSKAGSPSSSSANSRQHGRLHTLNQAVGRFLLGRNYDNEGSEYSTDSTCHNMERDIDGAYGSQSI